MVTAYTATGEIKNVILKIICIICITTVKDQKYFHNVKNSIDLRVFSCIQEKLSCLSRSTYFRDFGVI